MMDWVVQGAMLADGSGPMDVGIAAGRIAAIAATLPVEAPVIPAGGCLLTPGLVETHVHLDKTCILDRCTAAEGSVAEAVRLTSAAKRSFTPEDVYARGRRTLEHAIGWGTTRMRTHVEVDPASACAASRACSFWRATTPGPWTSSFACSRRRAC